MKIHDISMELEPDMPVYKGRKEMKPQFKVREDHESGDSHHTDLNFSLHTGTHVDAPLHMISGGETMEYMPEDKLISPCQVIDMSQAGECIAAADLEELKNSEIGEDEFLLFKSKNTEEDLLQDAPEEFVYIAEDAADLLTEINPAGVGLDSLGIERAQPGHPSHRRLLAAGIVIVEGLDLEGIRPGRYKLVLAPLRLDKYEAAPARALLLEVESLN